MKKTPLLVVLVGLALVLVSCAAGVNDRVGTANAEGHVAGFWLGLWHGMICPITFIVSLFTDGVQVYEVHNNGGWYNFGFVFGILAFHGGGHAARGRRRKRKL